ncbi:DUF7064 domain-containing protein [Hyphomonas johnsonii]|uniref:Uncharacterized protein n=1 Tax=Hyphomonas johnsonii MHS-2 TaxID=1280950 RepID=A0A059FNC9_9PROT|nr:hypothetical protein [Hyphomonas johnsonii]KCZ92144.1 hypothetical protein HJO_08919 [Hyphomonas johnsonii MHS-2]
MSIYSEVDFPHKPGAHPDWQESWVLIFRDPLTGAVGFLRTGAYVNQALTQTHWGMALPDGTRFRRHVLDRKLEPGDLTDTTMNSGNMQFSIPNMEYCRFEAQDEDADVDLRIYDWFPSQDWAFVGGPLHGKLLADAGPAGQGDVGATGHPESAGRVEGRIRIGDRVIEIENGIGYRDHGYGPRAHTIFRAARWHAGTVGPNLSYSLISMLDNGGAFHKFGWVMLNGKREVVKDLHTVSCTLADGCSVIGGWTVVQLENGQTLRINAETVDGVVTSTHLNNGGPGSSPAGIEALSIPRWNGQAGVCDFNMIDNAHRGEQEVSHTFLANCQDGLSQRTFDASWIR